MKRLTILRTAFFIAVVVSMLPAAGAFAGSAVSPPSASVVANHRFVVATELGNGTVIVTPTSNVPTRRLTSAATQVWATTQVQGYSAVALGFGEVTITKVTNGMPTVKKLAAWVGLVKDSNVYYCPAMKPGHKNVRPPANSTANWAAVIVGDAPGSPAVVYMAVRADCGSLFPARLVLATERISVPWKATGPLKGQSLPVEFAMPTCASYIGPESNGSKSSVTISIDVLRNENASAMYCTASPSTLKKDIYLGRPGPGSSSPLVTKSTVIGHGPTGPVGEVR
jgi:hypothetical protein